MTVRVVCIEPHNDDCAIGVGGTIAALVKRGAIVSFLCVTDGRKGGDGKMRPEEVVSVREAEAVKERAVLEIATAKDLGFQDGTLAEMEAAEVCAPIADFLRQQKPDVVLLPSKSEAHSDHRATHDIALEACKSAPQALVVKYSVWLLPSFHPEVQTDPADVVLIKGIDDHLAIKRRAIRQHKSQLPRGDYDKRAEALSRYLGLALKARKRFGQHGQQHVEVLGCFEVDRHKQAFRALKKLLQPCEEATEVEHGAHREA